MTKNELNKLIEGGYIKTLTTTPRAKTRKTKTKLAIGPSKESEFTAVLVKTSSRFNYERLTAFAENNFTNVNIKLWQPEKTENKPQA